MQIRPAWSGNAVIPSDCRQTQDYDFGVTAIGPLIAGGDITISIGNTRHVGGIDLQRGQRRTLLSPRFAFERSS